MGIFHCRSHESGVGAGGSILPLFRHLAARYQHRDYDRHIPNGIPHSEHSKSGCARHTPRIGRVIRAIDVAQNDMIDIGKLSDEELESLSRKFESIRNKFESRKEQKQQKAESTDARHRASEPESPADYPSF
jgi:hypothetical protein